MSEEHKANLENEARQGQQAKQILNNPLFEQTWTMLEAHYLAAFEQTKFDDDAGRKEIYLTLHNMKQFKNQLIQVINTGKMAEKSLIDKARDFMKR